jgi:hypothetical protein
MRHSLVFVFLLAVLTACSEQDVSVYRVPKESRTAAPPSAGFPALASEGRTLAWSLPKGWKKKPPSEMRLASFSYAGKSGREADISIVSLPGEAGGVLANVNRWRGQLGLAGLQEKDLSRFLRRLKAPAGEVLLADIHGEGPAEGRRRLIAAILLRQGQTWFFKMTGEEAVVSQAAPSFEMFLGSLRHGSH